MKNFSLPLSNPAHEAEAQEYARSYNCTIEKARLDVDSEMNATETAVDAFYTRLEADMQDPTRIRGYC